MTMQKIKHIFVLISTIAVLTPSVYGEMPGPDPAEIWNYITKISPYKKWSYWPEHPGMQQGRAPHGPKHKVFVNKLALMSKRPPLKYGSMQVKENYNRAEVLKSITLMYKVKGFNTRDGDWFWAKYTLKGKAKPFGKVRGCIGCHGTRERNDFVLVHDF